MFFGVSTKPLTILCEDSIVATRHRALFLFLSSFQMASQLPRMKKRENIVHCGLLFLLFTLLLSPLHALALEATKDEIDLDSLSDLELEEICALRGFELVKEDILSHDDYVEAARQCLAIERDMEEIIAEHPEIVKELEEERDRMMAEKERLEQELAAKAENRTATESQHTALISDKQKISDEEQINLDSEDSKFDVIGHQEPLSDTRVHEESFVRDSSTRDNSNADMNSPVDSTDVTQMVEGEGTNVNVQIWTEMRERITRDFNLVANVVFPKAIRGPVKSIVHSAGKVAKQVAMDLYKFIKRYVMAFIERQKNRTETEQDETAVAAT